MRPTLLRRVVAEFTGTLLLLAAVVGSGIMGERLAGGNVASLCLRIRLRQGLRSSPSSLRLAQSPERI